MTSEWGREGLETGYGIWNTAFKFRCKTNRFLGTQIETRHEPSSCVRVETLRQIYTGRDLVR